MKQNQHQNKKERKLKRTKFSKPQLIQTLEAPHQLKNFPKRELQLIKLHLSSKLNSISTPIP